MNLQITEDQIHTTPYCTITYVLELEDDNWYVGKTNNFNVRMCEHFSPDHRGAQWTKLHKPVNIVDVIIGDREKEKTLEYMERYGCENVRGSHWCQLEYPSDWQPPYTLETYKKRLKDPLHNTLSHRLTDLQYEIFDVIKTSGEAVSMEWIKAQGYNKSTIKRAIENCLMDPPLLKETKNGYLVTN